MIVNSMTFDEITEYLLKKSFSSKNIDEIYNRNVVPKINLYRRQCIKWNQKQVRSMYRKFNPIINNGIYDEEVVLVPFCTNKKYVDFIIFTQFHYRGSKYVAFKQANNSSVVYYSWHTLKRYSERFLKEDESYINIDFISDMLIRNTGSIKTTYKHKGETTIMYVSTDGGFLCDEYKKSVVVRTFISQEQYFSNQEQLDGTAFEKLKRYKKETYGYWLDRA